MKLLCLAAILIVSACSLGPTTHDIRTPGGRLIGYLTTYESSADTCGWLNGSMIHDPDLTLRDHRVVTAPGITCAVLTAGAIVGGSYLLGSSFPNNVGDVVTSASESSSSTNHSFIREHYRPDRKRR